MPIYRIQTSLQSDSGLPRDLFVNSIHVNTGSQESPTNLEAICHKVEDFYKAMNNYLSPVIAQNGHTCKVYLQGAPLETPPKAQTVWSLTSAPSGAALPNEVASCVSFHGDRNVAWQPQSNRGRIYLGPLAQNAADMVAGGGSVPSTAFRTEAVTRAVQMGEGIGALQSEWVIWSKLHNASTQVKSVSMDNEWDTVRSRGYRATAKTIMPLDV
jgi:hypothetical protein